MLYGVSKLCSACSSHFQAASPPPLLIFLDHYCLRTLVMAIFNKYASFKSALTMGNSHIIAHFFPQNANANVTMLREKNLVWKVGIKVAVIFYRLAVKVCRDLATVSMPLTWLFWLTIPCGVHMYRIVVNCQDLKIVTKELIYTDIPLKKGTYKEKVSISDGYSSTGMPHTALH